MANKKSPSRGFTVLITVLVILLLLAIALFVYGSMTNGLVKPRLPGKSLIALGTSCFHG